MRVYAILYEVGLHASTHDLGVSTAKVKSKELSTAMIIIILQNTVGT